MLCVGVVLLKHDIGIWFHFWWKFNLLMVALKLYFMRDLRLILYPQPYSWVWVKMWWVSHSFCLSHLKHRTKECIRTNYMPFIELRLAIVDVFRFNNKMPTFWCQALNTCSFFSKWIYSSFSPNCKRDWLLCSNFCDHDKFRWPALRNFSYFQQWFSISKLQFR